MSRRARTALAAGCGALLLLGGCVAAAWPRSSSVVHAPGRPAGGGIWAAVFLGCSAAAFLLYLVALAALGRTPRVGLAPVATLALAIQLVPLAAPLIGSADAWSYWDYGRIATVHDADPYVAPPSRFRRDAAFAYVGWRDSTSVYGPAFTLASEPVALAAGASPSAAAWIYKSVAALAMLGITALAGSLVTRPARAVALLGWNPLLALGAAGGGHNDALAVAAVLAALALALRRPAGAGAAWALAGGVKWLPLAFVPLDGLGGRPRRYWLGLALAGALLAAAATATFGTSWARVFGPLASHAHTGTKDALPRRLESLTGLPHGAVFATALGLFALGYALLARRRLRGQPALGRAALLMFATTPWLLSWYAVWALALAAAEEDLPAELGALALCAYLLPQHIL